jgi:uncharacterized protein YkwD
VRIAPPLRAVIPAAVLLLAPLPTSGEAPCPEPSAIELEVVDRINAERAAENAPPVALDGRLFDAALGHSEDMRDGCFLSHTGSDGSTANARMSAAGYPNPLSEAAGAGQTSAGSIVSAWMASPPHRSILLDSRARHVGVGYASSPGTCFLTPFNATIAAHFWTADFGRASGPPVTPQELCGGDPEPECSDGLDNDGNGRTDSEDFHCESPDDPAEAPPCSDGIDNDGDGATDHPADPECLSPEQLSEFDPSCGLGFELVLVLPALLALRRDRRGDQASPSISCSSM